MNTNRVAYVLFVAAAFGSIANAQPAGFKIEPVPLLSSLLPCAGDANFQKELKLDDDQAKRLVEFRQKFWEETYTTAPAALKAGERAKAIDAEFKAVLKADQIERANQLATRFLVSSGRFGGFNTFQPIAVAAEPAIRSVSPMMFAQYPELAAGLKLDDTQTKIVAGATSRGFGAGDEMYLSNEQMAAMKAKMGAPPKEAIRTQNDPRLGFGGGALGGPGGGGGIGAGLIGARVPAELTMLTAPDVQKDLKLAETQIASFTELRTKFNQFRRDAQSSPAELRKKQDAAAADATAAIAKILNDEQKTRLQQIQRQQRVGTEFAESSELAKVLEITPEQRTAYADLAKKHDDAVIRAVESGEPLAKLKETVEAADKALAEAKDKILTEAQQAKKKEWLGSKFVGTVRPMLGGGPGGGVQSPAVTLRKLAFGKYFGELTMLNAYPALRKELGLSEDQTKKVTDSITELNQKFPLIDLLNNAADNASAEKFVTGYSGMVEKAVTSILTKEQLARLRELQIQQLNGPRTGPLGGSIGSANTPAGIPGVAEAIKLTDDQKKKILEGPLAAAREVYTEEQKKTLQAMGGKPAAIDEIFVRAGGFGGGGPRPAMPRTTALLQTPSYWMMIKISDEQAGKLAKALNEYNLMLNPNQPLTSERSTAANETLIKSVEGILSAEQRTRLEQLALQQTAARSIVTAMLGTVRVPSANVKQLAITDEQVKAIRAIAAESAERVTLLDSVDDTGRLPRKDLADLRMTLRNQLDEKAIAVLNKDQQTKWSAMLGEMEPTIVKSPLFSNRRGGFGGSFE